MHSRAVAVAFGLPGEPEQAATSATTPMTDTAFVAFRARVRLTPRAPPDRSCPGQKRVSGSAGSTRCGPSFRTELTALDRKSTRLNSSHVKISYAVCCLKEKK